MDLSIVIPVFNESKKIKGDIGSALKFLDKEGMSGEIMVVDDGSTDVTSDVTAEFETGQGNQVRTIRLHEHKGKGCAVREGIKLSKGDFVMFADSGCCVPYENMLIGLDLIKSGECEIANGSRKLNESKIYTPQGLLRRIYSQVFRKLLAFYLKIPAELTDTQCGFKIYQGETGRKLYGECVSDGFIFDVEIICRALKEGYRIKEFPVEWTCDKDSRFSLRKSFWQLYSELRMIRRRLKEE
ncbi:MAG: glycosyltransferase [Planctomycetota bacterium]|jgi:glycosyltransferase involved in cell wall biosynthesis